MLYSIRKQWLSYLIAMSGVAMVIVVFTLIIPGVNNTTVALCFLLIVQITASISNLGPSIIASIMGMLSFNYFFLPPVHTFTIADPQNWVALSAFLLTSIITSHLSSIARARAQDAERRREEVWKLYELGRIIIATPDSETAISSLAKQVVDAFKINYCSIFVPGEDGKLKQLTTSSINGEIAIPEGNTVDKVFGTGELRRVNLHKANKDAGIQNGMECITYAPLKVGLRTTGVIVIDSNNYEVAAIEAIASLIALALERTRFMQEVSHLEAIKQSDELKSALLASVSHNLRTPLTAIRTSIESILRGNGDMDKSTIHEFHLIISEEAYRLTRIVEHLLEMARIEAGELKIVKQWGSVSELFTNTINRSAGALHDHKLVVEVDETMPAVKMDSQMLSEVITNLLENAAKYSPPKTVIKLSAELNSGELIISVADEGPGIAQEEQEQIFDKFYRGEQNTQGTGMGLAIARGIVKAHGGKIWVESKLGQGSVFRFSIPTETKNLMEFIPLEEYA